MKISEIAAVCHAVNRAYCQSIGDHSQVQWEFATPEIQTSMVRGVVAVLRDPEITPEELHQKWMEAKAEDGWHYGPIKDADKKTHPCMVAYSLLPSDQRTKDYLFRATVKALADKAVVP